ncbi:MAG: hypothetical protein DYG88_08280 [Chloroflexi bacterium CFX4]|nr:hypothetical protein [Chloroflexi bacterium CFX4]MDL1921321.1 hypothetical protein [Chloroflexi bacterium CFX3]
MTKSKGIRTDFTEFDERVGKAWSLHTSGQDSAAIQEFRRLVDEWQDHVDANFGLALAYKTSGQHDKAREQFQKTLACIESELAKNVGGDTSRFQMLQRMVEQHLATLA